MLKQKIKEILLEQQEEAKKLPKEKIIPREKQKRICMALDDPFIKVIIGVRRCGKSLLAHSILKDRPYGYINFDDERFIGVKADDLNDFLETLMEINPEVRSILLDEIQNIAGWELFVNRLHRNGMNLVITGSNSRLLSKELATHQTGRHLSFELYPFSFHEYLRFHDLTVKKDDFYRTDARARFARELTAYLQYGGFPEVYKTQLRIEYLRELYTKIITRDIVERYHIRKTTTLKELLLYVLSHSGSKMTYHKLKRLFDLRSAHTIKHYLSYAEDAYLIGQLQPFSFKVKEVIRGARKFYGIDPGMISAVTSPSSPNHEHLLETTVFLELKRQGKEVYYYHDTHGHEVDFVIKEGTRIVELIQVCVSTEDPDTAKREIRALLKGSDALFCSELRIITLEEKREETIDGKTIVWTPLAQWLINGGREGRGQKEA